MTSRTLMKNHRTLSFIGFGEAAQAFAKGIMGDAPDLGVAAYDIKTASGDTATEAAKWQDYEAKGISGRASSAELLAGEKLVFCLVTADQALSAAKTAAQQIALGAFYFNGNSCAPKTKQASAQMIEAAGARYVDVAIMSPVHPAGHKAPLLVSGPHAEAVAEVLAGLGMMPKVEAGDIGRASSIKMIRSVMVKGIEALVAECVLAGTKAGVADVVLDSLDKTFPGFDWKARSAYNFERMMVHGNRRAAEMREVAITLSDLGLNNGMSTAIADWQQVIGGLNLDAGENNYDARANAILAALADGADEDQVVT
ncbi:MAG: 3-hydroxyisobutyrate dehydrogenase-like beta-hydroxyacid dehydrogenase [Paracoccaceae bacterium]|jgi:3-hydroxyisobutyrate dehydrogenase-like beta-hydroxyacid dehydrogenase